MHRQSGNEGTCSTNKYFRDNESGQGILLSSTRDVHFGGVIFSFSASDPPRFDVQICEAPVALPDYLLDTQLSQKSQHRKLNVAPKV